jgi:hypothetical protein
MKAIIAAVPELDERIIVRDFTKHRGAREGS